METQLANAMHWLSANAVPTSLAVAALLVFFVRWILQDRLPDLPVVGEPGEDDLRSAMEEGTRKYPNEPFILPFADPTVILPICELDRIKSLPDTQVSLNRNNYRRFFGQFTMMGLPAHEFIGAIKEDLTQNLNVLLPEMVEETAYALQGATKEPSGKDAFQVPAYPTLLQAITLVAGRVMVGLPLSRNPQWLHSSIHYAIDSVMASEMLRGYPKWMQPLVGIFSPKIAAVREHQKRVRDMLQPILERQEVRKSKRGARDAAGVKEGRLVAWLAAHYAKNNKLDVDIGTLGKDHLLALFAAIHIATNALTQSVLDLAARPEYADALRKELDDAQVHVERPESWTTGALAKLEKMDSFIQESLHWSPPGGVVAILRETQVPLKLLSGKTIPAGQLIAFPNTRFNKSQGETSQDFDGLRYSRLREEAGQRSKYQLTTPRQDLLTYGYGTHSCPGRAFATAQIKVALAYLLQRYQSVTLPAGEQRPPNSSKDWQIMPSPKAAICLQQKKVKVIPHVK